MNTNSDTLICHHYTVGDLLVMGDRHYYISGCFYGGINEDSLIELRARSHRTAAPYGHNLSAIYVPVKMLDALLRNHCATHYGQRKPETPGSSLVSAVERLKQDDSKHYNKALDDVIALIQMRKAQGNEH